MSQRKLTCVTASNGGRADRLWNSSLPLLDDSKANFSRRSSAAHVPDDQHKLTQWACVKKRFSSDPKRRYVLIYSPPLDSPRDTEKVTLRMQGFIASCDLRPLGNWKGCVINIFFNIDSV